MLPRVLVALALSLLATPTMAADYLPDGYLYFCKHNAALCQPQDGTLANADLAGTVNRAVNQRITYADDKAIVVGWTQPPAGTAPAPLLVTDTWTVNPKRGDCEDYAVTKLAALLDQGVGRDHLRLALTKVRGIGHIVLLAESADGWFVLDNLAQDPQPPDRYRMLAVETLGRAWAAQ